MKIIKKIIKTRRIIRRNNIINVTNINYINNTNNIVNINNNQQETISFKKSKKLKRKFNLNENNLQNAINYYNDNNYSIRMVALKFNISKSTLWNKIKNKYSKSRGRPTKLNEETEKKLIEYLILLQKTGIPMTKQQLRTTGNMLLNIENKNNEKLLDNQWTNNFIKRNKNLLSFRISENLDKKRYESFNKTNVEDFFTKLKSIYDSINDIDGTMIFNCDEIGISVEKQNVV